MRLPKFISGSFCNHIGFMRIDTQITMVGCTNCGKKWWYDRGDLFEGHQSFVEKQNKFIELCESYVKRM